MTDEEKKQRGWFNKLQNDEGYKSMMAEKQARIAEKEKLFAKEQAPILSELKRIGYDIGSVWHFVNTKNKYEKAIPILKKYLNNEYSSRTKEGIIRALAVEWYKDNELVTELFNLFESEEDFDLRWVIGNTLSAVSKTKEHADVALAILKSGKYGQSADQLVVCYSKIYKNQAVPELIEFINDEGLRNEAIDALGKLKAKEARSFIEPYLTHDDTWVRNKAKSAIKKIDKAK